MKRQALWSLALYCGPTAVALGSAASSPDVMSTRQIATNVSKATVSIRCALSGGATSAGSGFITDSSGTVVTNYHVVNGAERIEVKMAAGDTYEVTAIRAIDRMRDIAVLQIPGFKLPTVVLGDSDNLGPGEPIVVVGNALGVLDNSVTTGVVSGIREVDGRKLIQMSAAVSPGNSGGPVANERGEVVAITVLKLTSGESLNFAIPINFARGYLDQPAQPGLAMLRDTGAKSLFAESSRSFPKRWRSLLNNTYRTITTYDGGMIVENEIPSQYKEAGGRVWMDLRKDGDTWQGIQKNDIPCTFKSFGNPRTPKICHANLAAVVTSVTSTKIEGFGMQPAPDATFNCKQCTFEPPPTKTQFTWIPAEN